jgi:hypothetical protein
MGGFEVFAGIFKAPSVPVKKFPKWTLVFCGETALVAGAVRVRNLTPGPNVVLLHRTEMTSALQCFLGENKGERMFVITYRYHDID